MISQNPLASVSRKRGRKRGSSSPLCPSSDLSILFFVISPDRLDISRSISPMTVQQLPFRRLSPSRLLLRRCSVPSSRSQFPLPSEAVSSTDASIVADGTRPLSFGLVGYKELSNLQHPVLQVAAIHGYGITAARHHHHARL